jgi:dihydrofolate synthase / folylpolyglutamate synthase
MRFECLQDWLGWQETLHPARIALDPERFHGVVRRLGLEAATGWVLMIAGTNGKGSSVAYAEAVLSEAGFKVGAYTSPHLLHYCERIRIDGRMVSEHDVMRAFAAIDAARGESTLTYFEFATLAARWLYREAAVDVEVLEIGMGGRLDAVNHLTPDVALITSIGLDHAEWLGSDREAIGREKAGILRGDRPGVFSGGDLPRSIREHAQAIGAALAVAGEDFHYREDALAAQAAGDGALPGGWTYADRHGVLTGLRPPPLGAGAQYANAAGVLRSLREFPGVQLDAALWNRAMGRVALQGRLQCVSRAGVEWLLDVAHNRESVEVLAEACDRRVPPRRRLACLAMMQRKDAPALLAPIRERIDGWFLLELPDPDARRPADLHGLLGSAPVLGSGDAAALFPRIDSSVEPGDEVLVFGSFRTVEEALRHLQTVDGGGG